MKLSLNQLISTFILALFCVTGIQFDGSLAWSAPTISPLKIDGRFIRDGSGRSILLKGLNIETHNWAYQSASYNTGSKTWSIANEAAVISDMQQMNAWLFIAEDMQRIKEWGANVIRLQVSHYFFESINSPGTYYDWAFSQLNKWIDLAAENGIYVIVDLHVPYGGRQYSCTADAACMEGKTLWLNASERRHVLNLWQAITLRTKHQPNVLYELMNEPFPQNAGLADTAWWNFAQELIDTIRAAGATQLIVAANPLPDGPFVKLSDSRNAVAYDFHFYLPYAFTHQQAYWMVNPTPPASYPYPDDWQWLENTYDHNETDFPGAANWTRWQESFSTADEISNQRPTHIQPTLSSYDNIGQVSFDHVRLFIDGVEQVLPNSGFQDGSSTFPDQWTQWGPEDVGLAFWGRDNATGNRFVTIPTTAGAKSRTVMPAWGIFYPLPAQYTEIRVEADVRGINENELGYHANVFGMNWVKRTVYDQSRMGNDIEKHRQFGLKNNVPVMCLEFGVIMTASEAQGHLAWLQDFSSLLEGQGLHGAYHVYRGYDDDINHKSFGIYQCWGKPASQCPADRKFEFVLPALKSWLRRSHVLPPLMLLLE